MAEVLAKRLDIFLSKSVLLRNYAAAHHLVTELDIVWTWGPLSTSSFRHWNNLAQSLALCTLWIWLVAVLWDLFFAVVFFRGNLGSFLLLLAYPLWATTAERIGDT